MKTTKEIARELGLLRRRSSSSQHARDMKKAQSRSQEFSFLLVLDFESTCWKEKDMNTCQEIIEFPAVLLNTSTGAIVDEFQSYVLPMEHPQLSKFCTELTGITQDMVDASAPLCVILSQFLKWMKKLAAEHKLDYHSTNDDKKLCTLVTWSDWDLGLCLHRECQRKQLFKPAVLASWIDLRATYKKFYQRRPNGLNGALQDVGIQFEGREHSGLDDARNTAQLAWKMIRDGCQMTITKTLDKGGGSRGLTKTTVSGSLNKPSAHPESTTSIGQCLQRPGSSTRPIASARPNSLTVLQSPGIQENTDVGQCLKRPGTTSGASSSVGQQGPKILQNSTVGQRLQKSGTSSRPSTSMGLNSSSTLNNNNVGQCLQKPGTSTTTRPSSVGQQSTSTPRSNYGQCLLRSGTSTATRPSSMNQHSTSTSRNNYVGQCLQRPGTSTTRPSSVGLQHQHNQARPQNSIGSKILQKPGQSVKLSGRKAIEDLPRSGATASFKTPPDRNTLKRTMTSKCRQSIDENGQRDAKKCNKNICCDIVYPGEENKVDGREQKHNMKMSSSLQESEEDFGTDLDEHGEVDLNACFIDDSDKENILNIINSLEDKVSDNKAFTSLKQQMKTPNTKVRIFNACKVHSEFKPPGKCNTILSYFERSRKSLGALKAKPTTFAGDHQIVSSCDQGGGNTGVTSPTWNSHTSIKEKISKNVSSGDDNNSNTDAATTPTWNSHTSIKEQCFKNMSSARSCLSRDSNTGSFTTPTWNSHMSTKERFFKNANSVCKASNTGSVTTPTSIKERFFKNFSSTRSCESKASSTGSAITPTFNSHTSLKEKITPPMCQCGRRTKRKVASRPGPNQNSPFFVCPKSNGYQSKVKSGCGYFQWESSVLKKNLNLYQKTKSINGRLSARYGSAVQIGTTPVNSNCKGSLGRTGQSFKPSLRTDFRIKPY